VVLYYFHDRDGLLEALAVRAVAPWRLAHDGLGGADATVKPDEPGGDPREQLNRWLAAMFTLAVREREALRVRLAMLGEPPNAPWRTHVDACDRLALRQLALLMARGHGQYAWHAPDAARAALLVRGLVEGLSLEALRSDADTVTRLHGQCRGAVLDLLVRR
jgi:AcrR family transcriptional regulator